MKPHYRIHIEQSPFSIQLLSPEGKTLAVNKAWKDLWRIPEDVIQNYILKDYNVGTDPQLEEKGLGPLIRKGLTGETVELPAIHYIPNDTEIQGDPRWVTGFMYPVRDDQGKLIEIVLIHRDITETKLAEEELKKTNEKLELAVKARDEFISICSHELKTPITSLKLQFQSAQRMLLAGDERFFTKENQEKRLKSTNHQLDRMVGLIDEMLDISRLNVGKLELHKTELNFRELVEEVLSRFTEQFELHAIKVTSAFESDHDIVTGDRYRLEQVLSNLINNAIKYGEGKPIEIKLSNTESTLRFEIKDSGKGIEESDLERIFHRFERISSAHNISGLGLGLYISKKIVEAHGGKIWAKSQINHGTTFIVELSER